MKSQWDRIQRFCWRHFASDLQRANHYLWQNDRLYSRLIAEAKTKPKSRDEVERLNGQWESELLSYRYEVDRLLTAYWLRRAARHHLPEPADNDRRYWKHDELTGLVASRLTDAGIDFIDQKFHEKRNRRIPLLTALTGIIGAATGLAAILLQHR